MMAMRNGVSPTTLTEPDPVLTNPRHSTPVWLARSPLRDAFSARPAHHRDMLSSASKFLSTQSTRRVEALSRGCTETLIRLFESGLWMKVARRRDDGCRGDGLCRP
jgi:hypothetical protein